MIVILLSVIHVEDNKRPSTNQSEAHQRASLYQPQTSILQLTQEDIAVYYNLFYNHIEILKKELSINVPICLNKIISYFSIYLLVYNYLLSFCNLS